VEVVRLGEQEEHTRWDNREQLRPALMWALKMVLGEEECGDEELQYQLLVQDEVTEALETIKADYDKDNTLSQAGELEVMKLRYLIMATKEGQIKETKRENMKPDVKAILNHRGEPEMKKLRYLMMATKEEQIRETDVKAIATKVLGEDGASDEFVSKVLKNYKVLEAAGKLQSETVEGEEEVRPSKIAAFVKLLKLLGNER